MLPPLVTRNSACIKVFVQEKESQGLVLDSGRFLIQNSLVLKFVFINNIKKVN